MSRASIGINRKSFVDQPSSFAITTIDNAMSPNEKVALKVTDQRTERAPPGRRIEPELMPFGRTECDRNASLMRHYRAIGE
jgi:hypothetical protein